MGTLILDFSGGKNMDLSLREIQQEITKWGLQQFGYENKSLFVGDPACGTPMGSILQLCGAFTELAEIMRPMIEMHQGRWNKKMTESERNAALREAYEDGAADLLIWFCHWAGLNYIDLQTVLNRVWREKVQHRTQKDWEKIKAKEDKYQWAEHKGDDGFNEDMSEAYRDACCEAMSSEQREAFAQHLKEEVDRPVREANQETILCQGGFQPVKRGGNDPADMSMVYREGRCEAMASLPKEDNRPKPASVCPRCKTKFSDRVPNYCPECDFHLHLLDKG